MHKRPELCYHTTWQRLDVRAVWMDYGITSQRLPRQLLGITREAVSHTHTHIHTGKRKREGKSTPGGQGVTITGTGRTIHNDITNINKMFK